MRRAAGQYYRTDDRESVAEGGVIGEGKTRKQEGSEFEDHSPSLTEKY